MRREVEAQRIMNSKTKDNIEELQSEKEALESNGPIDYSVETQAEVDRILENDDVLNN